MAQPENSVDSKFGTPEVGEQQYLLNKSYYLMITVSMIS